MRGKKNKDITWKIGYKASQNEIKTPTTPAENTPEVFALRRYPIHQLHPPPISRLPGLNPDSENIAKHQIKEFRKYRVQESEETNFVKLCRQGGRKDLLFHKMENNILENAVKSEKIIPLSEAHCLLDLPVEPNHKSRWRKKKNIEEKEIPIIDQITSQMPKHRPKYRPDIVPIDDQAKLYFAYNRNNGTITRIIATSPRSFRF